MTKNEFKILHSEAIMYCQCIEFDLKRIYSGMADGDFDSTLDMLENSNLGRTIKELKKLDYSDGVLDLSESYYVLLDQIREIRNYWCHQCYVDYVYISDNKRREGEFEKIAERLSVEHDKLYRTHRLLESVYMNEFNDNFRAKESSK